MKRILKWIGIGLASLVGLLVVAGGVLHLVGSNRLQNAPAVAVQTVEVHNSPEVLARGQRLATISSCNGCHGLDLGGQVFNDEPPLGYLPAPNLTGGAGGVGAVYTAQDWDRAIRHGVAADGRPLLIMAAHHYAAYGDEDLAALIAYLQSLPPVDKELGPRRIPLPGTIIFGLLAYNDVTSVNKIDHAAVGGAAPPRRGDRRIRPIPGPDRLLRLLPRRRSGWQHQPQRAPGAQHHPGRSPSGVEPGRLRDRPAHRPDAGRPPDGSRNALAGLCHPDRHGTGRDLGVYQQPAARPIGEAHRASVESDACLPVHDRIRPADALQAAAALVHEASGWPPSARATVAVIPIRTEPGLQ